MTAVDPIYIRPDGNDSAEGTPDAPLKTLEGALARHREQRHAQPGPAEWVLGDGEFVFEQPLVLTEADADPDHPLTIRADAGRTPVLTSLRPVIGWTPGDDPAIPQPLRGKVWSADMSRCPGYRGDFRALFRDGRMIDRARGRGFQPTIEVQGGRKFHDRDLLHLPPEMVEVITSTGSPEVFIRPHQSWLVNYLDIESVDADNAVARTAITGTYRLDRVTNMPKEDSCWIENVLAVLSPEKPWVLDRNTDTLWLHAESDPNEQDIRFPTLRELIRVEGRNVTDAVSGDVPAEGFHFEGLTFTGGDRDVWTREDRGIQHDWDMYDKDNALLRFRGAAHCAVRRCTFRDSGGDGVRCDLFAQHITIEHNRMDELGGTGVLLCGYGPGQKDVNRHNLVRANEIARVGRLFWHAPAIFLWQSGSNQLLNNRIYDLHYTAVVLSGVRPRFFKVREPAEWGTNFSMPEDVREYLGLIRWDEVGRIEGREDALRYAIGTDNLVQDNEIHDVMKTLADGNAIYLSCSGPGNRVSRNLLYDCPRVGSEIRFDDDQDDSTVEFNVVIGNGIKLKHRNKILNNIIIGGTLIFFRTAEPGSEVRHNVVYSIYKPGFMYCDDLDLIASIKPDENLFYSPDEQELRERLEQVQQVGADTGSRVADPMFEDLAGGDLRFKPQSPALAMGIEPIDMSTIGLPDDPAQPRLARIISLEKRQASYFVE